MSSSKLDKMLNIAAKIQAWKEAIEEIGDDELELMINYYVREFEYSKDQALLEIIAIERTLDVITT